MWDDLVGYSTCIPCCIPCRFVVHRIHLFGAEINRTGFDIMFNAEQSRTSPFHTHVHAAMPPHPFRTHSIHMQYRWCWLPNSGSPASSLAAGSPAASHSNGKGPDSSHSADKGLLTCRPPCLLPSLSGLLLASGGHLGGTCGGAPCLWWGTCIVHS